METIKENYAEQYLRYYCDLKNDLNFAVLLDGPWGSGKTYFIKHFFQTLNSERRDHDPLSDNLELYSSLYGVKSIDEVSDQFFAQTHPLLSARSSRLLGAGARDLIKKYTGTALSEKDLANFKLKASMATQKILIFDDLERAALPLSEIMGFINSFVEHDKHRVIIIANQIELPSEQKILYEKQREKLVGKILRPQSDPSIIYDCAVNSLRDPAAMRVAKAAKVDGLRIFENSRTENFRSLKIVLHDFDRLISLIDPDLKVPESVLSQILLATLALGLEFRAAKIDPDFLDKLSEHITALGVFFGEPKAPDLLRARDLKNSYPSVNWFNPIIDFKYMARLFVTGTAAISDINKSLATNPEVIGLEDAPSWRILWGLEALSQTEFDKAIQNIFSDMFQLKYIHPGEILHVAGQIITLKQIYETDIFPNNLSIFDVFKDYIYVISNLGRLEFRHLGEDYRRNSYKGIMFQGRDTDEFLQIREILDISIKKLKENYISLSCDDILNTIRTDNSKYEFLYDLDTKNMFFMENPVLKSINVDYFASLVIVDAKLNSKLLAALTDRYSTRMATKYLFEEWSWILLLRDKLHQISSQQKPPFCVLLDIHVDFFFDSIKRHFASELEERNSRIPP